MPHGSMFMPRGLAQAQEHHQAAKHEPITIDRAPIGQAKLGDFLDFLVFLLIFYGILGA